MTNKKQPQKNDSRGEVAKLIDKAVLWLFAAGVIVVVCLFIYVLIREFTAP